MFFKQNRNAMDVRLSNTCMGSFAQVMLEIEHYGLYFRRQVAVSWLVHSFSSCL
jgi:hypothetical protein